MASGLGALPERVNGGSCAETGKVAMITGITGQVGICDSVRNVLVVLSYDFWARTVFYFVFDLIEGWVGVYTLIMYQFSS